MAKSGKKWQFLPRLGRVLDGGSRRVLAKDIRPTMRETDAEVVVQKAREDHPEGMRRESGLNRGLALIACGSMPEDDSEGSTDLSEVFLRAMATPVIRPIAVWMISSPGSCRAC